ncbi:hypothetical protein MNBD_NITROSPINAE02-749 [hydrothermal vent metagenome]|uniref:Sulfate transporter, CysZ-type n=1 Tax=hydrothermal vent metagenome TaxID=652676 RepID=A0A3B1CAR3_9ZZZZ
MNQPRNILHAPKGFFYLLRGMKLILSEWRLLRLAALPLVVNILIFVIFFFSFNYFAYEISQWVFTQGDDVWYWHILSWITGILLFSLSLVVVIFGFVAIGLVVAAPFNDMLCAAIEEKVTGKTISINMSIMELALYTMKNEGKKMVVIIAIQLVLILMNLIPVVGQFLFLVLNPLFLMIVAAFEFISFTLDRRGNSFAQKKDYLMSRLGLSLGFGLSVCITLIIPVVNFILLPVAVAGGTLFVIENPPDDAGEQNDG